MCLLCGELVFFFKQKTAYEMRISDWSSDVCSSDLFGQRRFLRLVDHRAGHAELARRIMIAEAGTVIVCSSLSFAIAATGSRLVPRTAAAPARTIRRAGTECLDMETLLGRCDI